MFSQFGPILDIVALKTQKGRGQAFIVFRDTITASNAMRELQDFVFFDKPLNIHYAKTTSDIVAKMEGTFQSKEKRAQEALEAEEKKRKAIGNLEEEPNAKRVAGKLPQGQSQPDVDEMALRQIPPNKTLFVQNLPLECTDNMLAALFRKYPGFVEVRIPPGQKGVAFVDYVNEIQAGVAMGQLQGLRIANDHPMIISFQKLRTE
uniref:RRM domain-containing protein n=1 Tax=Arcella intermedia TaxID=1963864 RepID=A0A6B2LGD1_9EUKA